jgi:hypothetical protein
MRRACSIFIPARSATRLPVHAPHYFLHLLYTSIEILIEQQEPDCGLYRSRFKPDSSTSHLRHCLNRPQGQSAHLTQHVATFISYPALTLHLGWSLAAAILL